MAWVLVSRFHGVGFHVWVLVSRFWFGHVRPPFPGPPFPGPPFPRPSGPLGLHTTTRELQTCTFEGPGFHKNHQNSTRKPPEREEKNEFCGGRARNFGRRRGSGGGREIPRKDPQERERRMKILWLEKEKKREILGPPPFGAKPTLAILIRPTLAKPTSPGLHTTTQELQTCTFQGPGLQKHHKNSTKGPPREGEKNENIVVGEGEKRAKFWAVRRRVVQRRGGVQREGVSSGGGCPAAGVSSGGGVQRRGCPGFRVQGSCFGDRKQEQNKKETKSKMRKKKKKQNKVKERQKTKRKNEKKEETEQTPSVRLRPISSSASWPKSYCPKSNWPKSSILDEIDPRNFRALL